MDDYIPAMTPKNSPEQGSGPVIVYDGECPFCAAYVRMLRLRAAAGPVTLVNARSETHLVMEQFHAANLDLNSGMVVALNGALYHGDAAMTLLASLTTSSGLFNRLSAWIFRSPARARVIYPPMVAGRNLTLRLLGRRKLGCA